MGLIRRDPFNEVRSLTRRIERAFEPLFSFEREAQPTVPWEGWPPVDIYEDKEEVVFRVEVPGLEQKEIELVIEDSTLTLRGERHLLKEEKKENYKRVESCYGPFSRSFTLPATIDRDKVRAELKNGVLEVHIPKREGAKGKTIPISG